MEVTTKNMDIDTADTDAGITTITIRINIDTIGKADQKYISNMLQTHSTKIETDVL